MDAPYTRPHPFGETWGIDLGPLALDQHQQEGQAEREAEREAERQAEREAQRRQQRELACLMQAELERSEDEGAYEAAVFDSFWRSEFEAVAEAIDPSLSPEESAAVLRDLIGRNLLSYTDMRDNPERFFEAHRLLSKRLVGGFGIRFTVQYNLFAGSILGLGGEAQVAMLGQLQRDRALGCFALTEKGAGVNSGLVVNTTATWDPKKRNFVLHTPDELARKAWISQGLTASQMVVIADLIVAGKSHGPHAFLMPLRDEHGQLTPGVQVGDMGSKTVANDLDNAWIAFSQVAIPESCMLDRFCAIDGKGQYVSRGGETMRLEVIGQRLLTGRMCISQAALVFARTLFANTRKYSDGKACWSPVETDQLKLSDVPQLAALFERADSELSAVEHFVSQVEAELCECLRHSTIPSDELVEAIAVCKIRGVGRSAELCFQLQQEVGSFALLGGGGFEHLDMLLCCKFAEGDERILMQKMARDRLKSVQGGGLSGWCELGADLLADQPRRREAIKALQLALAMRTAQPSRAADEHAARTDHEMAEMYATLMSMEKPGLMRSAPPHEVWREPESSAARAARKEAEKAAMVSAWAESWEEVYALAEAICDRHIAEMARKQRSPDEAREAAELEMQMGQIGLHPLISARL